MAKNKSTHLEFLGLFDRLPERERFFIQVEAELSKLSSFYGFEPIATSLVDDSKTQQPLEKAGFFFERSPITSRLPDGSELALRISGALSVVRAYTTHKMNDWPHPLKFHFKGDIFFTTAQNRNPQTFFEQGLMMIGEEGPIVEAEIIQVLRKVLEKVGVDLAKAELKINAIGCEGCRVTFRSSLMSHIRNKVHRLCKNCKRSLKRSPTRILTCKEEQCRMIAANAPQVLDYLCEVCKKQLRGVLEFLDEAKIPYFLDSKFFREGSWYSSILFEIVETREHGGAQTRFVLAEGGRISKAAELLAGKRIDSACGILFADNVQKLLSGGVEGPQGEKPRVFLTQLGELAKRKSLGLIETLRAGGIPVQESLGRDSVKSQLKVAERVGAQIALILGQKEALDNTIIVREIESGIQETVPQEKLVDFLKRKFERQL